MSLLNGGPSGNGGFDLDAWTAGDRSFPASGHTSPGRNNPGLPNISSGAPYLSGSMMNSHLHQREGDWICHGCSTVNFAKRTRCTKCGSLKQKRATEIGGPSNDGAPFSTQPGLFKRGDWPCTHCGNVNWARRDKCNVCNALKPFITEAPRTGRGGGHYDLQDPHDRQQHLSDEESFDEFGRRKKKKNASSKNATPSTGALSSSQSVTHHDLSGSMSSHQYDATSTTASALSNLQTDDGQPPLKLHFPPPPPCYLKGRTASMSSLSSRTSDYEDSSYSNDERHGV